ncbi:MAG: GerMN domain-containing protein [Eubacterium sp.]|nr:GerMN domain-containing protein [Eubacterium sp.]
MKSFTKKLFLFLTILTMAFVLASCGDGKDGNYMVYYIESDYSSIAAESFEVIEETQGAIVDELIECMDDDETEDDLINPLFGDLEIKKYEINDNIISLYFSSEYSELEKNVEVLVRTAVVETLLQVPDVSGVYFYVGDIPLTDSSGNVIGIMTADSFAINPGSQINTLASADITLYFASEDGKGLVKEQQRVNYVSSTSLERLVVERLIEGPSSSQSRSSVPENTNILSVVVNDGICYINFDEGFLVQDYDVTEQVVIYSIVNSVLELGTTSKVQISVNGSSDLVYRDALSLDQMFTKDLSLVVNEDIVSETEVELTEQ